MLALAIDGIESALRQCKRLAGSADRYEAEGTPRRAPAPREWSPATGAFVGAPTNPGLTGIAPTG
jgi:hypothetical protein